LNFYQTPICNVLVGVSECKASQKLKEKIPLSNATSTKFNPLNANQTIRCFW